MRKSTINLILGILIGLIISQISNYNYMDSSEVGVEANIATTTPIVEQNKVLPFEQKIAPGLQIIEVPPPLDLMGNHPYQCYMNGEPIKIPKELVKELVAKHGNPTQNDPNFNVHNFTGNLKMISVPVGATLPMNAQSTSFNLE